MKNVGKALSVNRAERTDEAVAAQAKTCVLGEDRSFGSERGVRMGICTICAQCVSSCLFCFVYHCTCVSALKPAL